MGCNSIRTAGVIRVIVLSILAALVVGAALPYLIPNPSLIGTIPEQPFEDSRFVELQGTRLHWRGRSPESARGLIILLHGFGGSGFSWRSSLDALEQAGYRVIAPDLPPFGYSERTAGGPDWPDLVIELAEQQADDLPWLLVGHSMGVGVAAEIVNRRPDRTAGLIMVGGTPRLSEEHDGLTWLFALPPVGRWAEIWAARNLVKPDSIRRMLTSAFGRVPTEEEFEGYYRPLLVPDTYPALLRRMSARRPVSDDWMRRPHAILWGEFDAWVPIERAEALIERLPRAVPIEIVTGAGHNPMDTHPEAFDSMLLEQIERLLRSLDSQSARAPLNPDS
jgi:pimeloyl-ACP methyl ester carboxylesterase